MAEVIDLDEWEVLSANSSCKDEFEEEGFTYFDYFSKDLKPRGETSVGEKSVTFDGSEVPDPVAGGRSGENLVKLSSDFSSGKGLGVVIDPDSDKECSDLARGYDAKNSLYVTDDPKFVSSVNSDEHDSIGELGFGEMEVLNEFYSNQTVDGTVNYDMPCLTRENNLEGESEQTYSQNPDSSVFPFRGTDSSNSVYSSEPTGEILEWRSPKAILTEERKEQDGFMEMEVEPRSKISDGDCSKELNDIDSGTNNSNDSSFNFAKDPEEQNNLSDENKSKSTEAEVGSKVQDGAKGEVLLAWWKVPIEVIKYCVFGVRPVWSISVAMGFLGFLMFSRRYYLYKTRQKDSKTRPALKVHFDEKKRAMIQTRAARLNKAVSFVRPDPILRTRFPASGVTLFPAMSSFQWAP